MISNVNQHFNGTPLSTDAPMAHMSTNLHQQQEDAETQITLSNSSLFTEKISHSHNGGNITQIYFHDIKGYLEDKTVGKDLFLNVDTFQAFTLDYYWVYEVQQFFEFMIYLTNSASSVTFLTTNFSPFCAIIHFLTCCCVVACEKQDNIQFLNKVYS